MLGDLRKILSSFSKIMATTFLFVYEAKMNVNEENRRVSYKVLKQKYKFAF